jgi:hypothetical protein
MRRRGFIAALGGAAAWPIGVPAQRGEGVRRVYVLMAITWLKPLHSSSRYALTPQT